MQRYAAADRTLLWQLDLHLPFRLRENVVRSESEFQEAPFCLPMSERGCTMYPFSDQFLKSQFRDGRS